MLPVLGSHGPFVAFMEETAKIDFSDLQHATTVQKGHPTARRAALSAEMGRLCRPRAFQYRRVAQANGPRDPKRKTRLQRVFLFGGGGES